MCNSTGMWAVFVPVVWRLFVNFHRHLKSVHFHSHVGSVSFHSYVHGLRTSYRHVSMHFQFLVVGLWAFSIQHQTSAHANFTICTYIHYSCILYVHGKALAFYS